MELYADECKLELLNRDDGRLIVSVTSERPGLPARLLLRSLKSAGHDSSAVAEIYCNRPLQFDDDKWPSLERFRGIAYLATGAKLPALREVVGSVDMRESASAPSLIDVTEHVTLMRGATLEALLMVNQEVRLNPQSSAPSLVGIGGDLVLVDHLEPQVASLKFIGGQVYTEEGEDPRWSLEGHLDGPQQQMGSMAALRAARHWIAMQRRLSVALEAASSDHATCPEYSGLLL